MTKEWLETDGLGGYAMGTSDGLSTRKYHSLLSVQPEASAERRLKLFPGFEAVLSCGGEDYPLSSHAFGEGIVSPDVRECFSEFSHFPWPSWQIEVGNGIRVCQELFMPRGMQGIFLSWSWKDAPEASFLRIRPFLSVSSHHQEQRKDDTLCLDTEKRSGEYRWQLLPETPTIIARTNGSFFEEPIWYEEFYYSEEEQRGYACHEDLASPGVFQWDLSAGSAELFVCCELRGDASSFESLPAVREGERLRRAQFGGPLELAAEQYLIGEKEPGIIAGFPWFGEWGRDTFIALRGLCLATEQFELAEAILLRWSKTISKGLLPNRLLEEEGSLEYNSVDAALWFVICVYELLRDASVAEQSATELRAAVEQVLKHFVEGGDYNIACDPNDALLAQGESGLQLTWMDASISGEPVTPRIGKPVEIQALWINALTVAEKLSIGDYGSLCARAKENFKERFWCEDTQCLYDVIDVDHCAGVVDASIRPNQLFSIAGLPFSVLEGERARKVVDVVEQQLFTPLGLRSLSPNDPEYMARCEGDQAERDAAYHQGTVWGWLIGVFVEAWVGVRGNTRESKAEAEKRFLEPLRTYLEQDGMGHLSEVYDGNQPHKARGCPFQAWSLSEFLRIESFLKRH